MDDRERETKLDGLVRLRQLGEKAYDEMYEVHSSSQATACYSDAKEFFRSAIALADELGLTGEANALRQRLDHIKAVFRSQFAS